VENIVCTSCSPENHGGSFKKTQKVSAKASMSVTTIGSSRTSKSKELPLRVAGKWPSEVNWPLGRLFLEPHRLFLAKSRLVDAPLDSTAGGRPNFRTTQWGLVIAASAEGAGEARAALEELYRLYCYPVYAFIRRRGHGRQDAQDLTQDFFVHLLEKGTLRRADSQRGRFRSFLLILVLATQHVDRINSHKLGHVETYELLCSPKQMIREQIYGFSFSNARCTEKKHRSREAQLAKGTTQQ
jgi:hypothetical protein